MGSIQLGKVLGIRLAVNGSWFFIFILVSWTLAGVYFPQQYPAWPVALAWAVGISTSLLFFACVVLHELAHSVVALRHQVPVRSITLFLFGGVSHITRDAPRPRVEFLIALAGPLASLALAALFGALHLGTRGSSEPVAALALWLAGINVSLGLFNLLPGLPLDGGRVLRSVLWFAADDFRWATRVSTLAGQLGALALIFGGFYLLFGVEDSVFSGGWLMLVGWFMYLAAGSNQHAAVVADVLNEVKVRDVMATDFDVVEAGHLLAAFADRYLLRQGRQVFVVVESGRQVGLIGLAELKRVPASRWPRVQVREAMLRAEAAPRVGPETPGGQALQAMAEAELEVAPVVADSQVIGLLSRADLLRVYEIRSRLRRQR
ncbi:MAG: site-2 protease family protein [Chloroflexi bacterium]|nr:site-2 protease family protein [Chloroflexota bacterium]